MQSHTFHDFDDFASAVRDVDSIMLLRNPQRRLWTIDAVDLQSVDVQLGRLGSGNIAQGELRPDGYLLYLPLTDGVEYTGNGVRLDMNSFAVLEPGCEFCISTKEQHNWCGVFVPTAAFGGGLNGHSSGYGKTTLRVARQDRQTADRFRSSVQQILFAASCSDFEHTAAAECARAELVRTVARIVAGCRKGETQGSGRPVIPRREIIRRAAQHLEMQAGEPVSVGDLASAAEVSERTLRTAFNEYFGMGPVRYLQLKQLHQVRRVLRAADPEAVTVTNVLLECGEWEFSRFASRYRRQFGELPSKTLRTNGR